MKIETEKTPTHNSSLPLFEDSKGDIHFVVQTGFRKYQICGFDVVGDKYHANRLDDTIIKNDEDIVAVAKKMGLKPYYGQVTFTITT